MDYIITTNISRGFYRRRRHRYAHMRNCRATHEDMPAGRCMVSSKQVADRKAACHALPRVVGHGHGQRKRYLEHPAYLLQVSVYVMQGGAVLFPLFVRVGRGDYREKIRCIGTGVAVDYLLKDGLPQEGDFPAGGLGAIDEVAVAYVVLCKMEDVAAGHAVGEDGEEEDVAGERQRRMERAEVEAAQALYLVERKAVLFLLYAVAHVYTFKGITLFGQAVVDSQLVNALQVADVERNGIAPELTVLKPGAVIMHKQGVEVLKRYIVLAQECNKPADIRIQLMGGVVTALCLDLINPGAGVRYETDALPAAVRYGRSSCICLFVYQLSFVLLFRHRAMNGAMLYYRTLYDDIAPLRVHYSCCLFTGVSSTSHTPSCT